MPNNPRLNRMVQANPYSFLAFAGENCDGKFVARELVAISAFPKPLKRFRPWLLRLAAPGSPARL
jgi:hypothetical protein